jgi:ribosomal-protein-alanine N-acetyltransferase
MRPKPVTGQLCIRSMKAKDLEAVHAIDKLSFSLPWPKSSYRYELEKNPASRLWVAEMEHDQGHHQVVGMIVIWRLVDEVHIATIAVEQAYRRQGIAYRLVFHALRNCVDEGYTFATLEVRESNLPAQALYHRFGFDVVGRRQGYYKDNNEDALLMSLQSLDPAHLEEIGYSAGKLG